MSACAKHDATHDCRIKAGAQVFTGDGPGRWGCDVCNPPASTLVEHGMIEWRDGRETRPMTPLVPNTREDILRCIEVGRVKGKVSVLARGTSPQADVDVDVDVDEVGATKPVASGSAPSEAKGPSAWEQAASGPVDSSDASPEPVRAAAPTRAPQAPAPKVFIDAAMMDLDAPPTPAPKPKKQRKKAASKTKSKPGETLF